MARWLSSIRSQLRRRAESGERAGGVLELLAVEGRDAGRKFTVDGEEVALGRGRSKTSQAGAIFLWDPSVSGQQAVLRRLADGVEIEHRIGASNPTCVNEEPITRRRIVAGDRIRVGRVVLEVREHLGVSLSTLLGESADRAPNERDDHTEIVSASAADRTEIRSVASTGSHLEVVRGVDGWEQRRFWLRSEATTLGRHAECDVPIPESGVSRIHAELVRERGRIVLVHRSHVNPTFVNGEVVHGRIELSDGDEIGLADRVVLRLKLDAGEEASLSAGAAASLRDRMEEKLRRDREIQDNFAVRGSFLDVDVVDSFGLKAPGTPPEAQIVSFERFRSFVTDVVEKHGGLVLNSNGDELMCFFEETLQAVRGAAAVLERLPDFNRRDNELAAPFRVRCGVHTGDSLVDRVRGVAYSEVLDLAGHLQKAAEIDGLLISEETLKELPPDLPFEEADPLAKNGRRAWRLMGRVG